MSKLYQQAIDNRHAQDLARAGSRQLTRAERTAQDSGLHTHLHQNVSDVVSKLERYLKERDFAYRNIATLLTNFENEVKEANTKNKTVVSENYYALLEELNLIDAEMDSLLDNLAPSHARRKEFIDEQNKRKESIHKLTSKFNALMNASETPAAGS